MLPYLAEEEIEELFQNVTESKDGSFRGIHIVELLPYLNEKTCDRLFLEVLNRGEDYLKIAPYVSDSAWTQIVDQYLMKELVFPMNELLPYMDDKSIAKIYQSVKEGKCTDIDVDSMLPYLSEEIIDDEFEKAIQEGENYKKYLPYTSEGSLHKYAEVYIRGESSVIDIDVAFPYMSNQDIKKIFQYEIGKEDMG